MTEEDRPPSLKQLDAKLQEIRAREGRDQATERTGGAPPAQASGLGVALRMGSELVAGVVVGAGLGWGLDRWLGTSPWLMVLCFLLGSAAGMLNVYRGLQRMGRTDGTGGR